MLGRFKYEHLPKYPHLFDTDKRVWDDFIDKYPKFFDRVDYDVRVGKGIDTNEEWTPEIKMMAIYLSMNRIDVVGYKNNTITIVEIKDRATSNAIGQVIVYRALYAWTYPDHPANRSLIICRSIPKDILDVAKAHKIDVITV